MPWVCIDPLNPDLKLHPLYCHAHRLEVTLEEGEVLYLPSLWFHHVQQEHGTIASEHDHKSQATVLFLPFLLSTVNYWYDMKFGMNYCYYQLLSGLSS